MTKEDQLMCEVRRINKFLRTPNKLEKMALEKQKEELVNIYAESKLEDCLHPECIDNGYYHIKGQDICVVDREKADLRVVECSDCGEEIYLIKTNNPDWDTTLGFSKLNITSKNKQKCKKM